MILRHRAADSVVGDKRTIGENPIFSNISRLEAPSKGQSRERVLSPDELTKIWKQAEKIGYPYGTIVRLLKRILERHFRQRLERRDLSSIRPGEIASVIDGTQSTASEAEHAFRYVRSFFNFCMKRGLIDASPVGPLAQELQTHLAKHGLPADLRMFKPIDNIVGAGLLAAAKEFNCDLLAMGAYANSRLLFPNTCYIFGKIVFGSSWAGNYPFSPSRCSRMNSRELGCP
jgi:nucleotide-binding universal stress UspA family protein